MKARESKLDPHAEKLIAWFTPKPEGGEGLTLQQARSRLSELDCAVSVNALSSWWQRYQQARMQERLLGRLASGGAFNKQLGKCLAENPPPELERLIKMLQTLIAMVAVNGDLDTDVMKVVGHLVSVVMDYEKSRAAHEIKLKEMTQRDDLAKATRELKTKELDLTERRVKLLEEKAAQYDQAKAALGDGALTEDQKKERIRQIFGLQ